ncbi:MAG: hypothetical protein K2X81_19815, partial [Candidatus Obscuribacterales bacterium]|nr:hypothetical protein [Candidatus Obscuribacterales bacterium]
SQDSQQSILEAAEKKYGRNDTRLADLIVRAAENFETSDPRKCDELMNRAASMIESFEPSQGGVVRVRDLASYFISRKELNKADLVLRSEYRILRTAIDPDGSLLENTVSELAHEYCSQNQFLKAESIILLAKSQTKGSAKPDSKWSDDLDTIYLLYAAKMKQKGNMRESKRLLARSNEEFEKSLRAMADSRKNWPNNNASVEAERLKTSRQNQLEQWGLDHLFKRPT